MKKLLIFAMTTALAFSITACGASKTDSSTTETTTEKTEMANPWTETASSGDAAEGAGVGYFMVPEAGKEYENGLLGWDTFKYSEGIAEADGFIGAAELTVRKGLKQDTEDVSGDYNEYKYNWEEKIGDFTLKCYGNEEGKAKKTIWVSDNFSYSISVLGQGDESETFGLGSADIKALASEIQ